MVPFDLSLYALYIRNKLRTEKFNSCSCLVNIIYNFSLNTEILSIFVYSIFLRVIHYFDQVPYLSLQFKAAKQYSGHVVEGKTGARIKVTGIRRKKRNQLLDDIEENRRYCK
jgi:hypothetical protein